MFHNIFMIIRKDINISSLLNQKNKSPKKKKIKDYDDIYILLLLN